jgi:transcriptional regulator with XRE-family HTH domain
MATDDNASRFGKTGRGRVTDETIGQRLKRLRLERGLSQRELAAPGVSYAYISRIEAGTRQPSVKALRRLAAKLAVSPDYLETGSDLGAGEERELRLGELELAVRLGETAGVEEPLGALAEEAIAAGDTDTALRARFALAALAQERGEYAVAVQLLESALEGEPFEPAERLDIYSQLGRAYAATGHPERAVELFERCLAEIAGDESDPSLEARYAALLSYALSDMGELGRAEEVVQHAIDVVQENADAYTRVRLYWSASRLAHREGRASTALANVRKAIALLQATDDTLHLARAHLLAASIMIAREQPDAAAASLDDCERLLGSTPDFADLVMLRVKRAMVATLRRDGAEAVRLAREAIEMIGDSSPAELGSAFFALGEGLSLEHEQQGADEAFRHAVELLEQQSQWREATQACRAWARTLRAAGREEQALDVLDRAAELGLRATPTEAQTAR